MPWHILTQEKQAAWRGETLELFKEVEGCVPHICMHIWYKHTLTELPLPTPCPSWSELATAYIHTSSYTPTFSHTYRELATTASLAQLDAKLDARAWDREWRIACERLDDKADAQEASALRARLAEAEGVGGGLWWMDGCCRSFCVLRGACWCLLERMDG